ncbi:agmatine deiminase family protein [Paraglaciecola sp. L3A3]|uniref:agmatine deiminase family protein n=1 Tax=Paraglaciecola sp. L3A3 TaxID=2686358 RepID=UPI0018EF0666|nr:agmatine deiminase family protein [Paraglaciecola sp. L3A3]
MTNQIKLLPEWSPQEAIILAWPDQHTDWAPWLAEVQNVYLEIIKTLNSIQVGVILLIKKELKDSCKQQLAENARVLLVTADYNDTWVRDYAFLTCTDQIKNLPIEFIFNGWGQKFNASKDNKVNRQVLAQLCQNKLKTVDLVVEGGALEIDEHGVLLSTELCLSNPKRNGSFTLAEYETVFAEQLGTEQVIIFKNGHLEGDDTDGHIDTLVRFTPNCGLVIQSAFNRPADSHFTGLNALVEECRKALPRHEIFELPLPYIVNKEGDRLPASYANYLISNQILLCPTYQQAEDTEALGILQKAYPEHKIIGINCLPLVQQFGSLHCISMQVPKGTLKTEVVQQFAKGVTEYEC